jgi:hypothetical protein
VPNWLIELCLLSFLEKNAFLGRTRSRRDKVVEAAQVIVVRIDQGNRRVCPSNSALFYLVDRTVCLSSEFLQSKEGPMGGLYAHMRKNGQYVGLSEGRRNMSIGWIYWLSLFQISQKLRSNVNKYCAQMVSWLLFLVDKSFV